MLRVRLEAVSYTHLDVYKRQIPDMSIYPKLIIILQILHLFKSMLNTAYGCTVALYIMCFDLAFYFIYPLLMYVLLFELLVHWCFCKLF